MWEDYIKMACREDCLMYANWTEVALDKVQWWAL